MYSAWIVHIAIGGAAEYRHKRSAVTDTTAGPVGVLTVVADLDLENGTRAPTALF